MLEDDYEYTESDLPPEYKGFPLLLGTKGLKEYKKSATNEGTIFELSHDPMRDSEKTMTKFLFRIMEGRTKIPAWAYNSRKARPVCKPVHTTPGVAAALSSTCCT